MMNRLLLACLAGVMLLLSSASAQYRPARPAGEILHELKGLKVLGSVLYIAAHPDDENTRLLAYLANGRHFRTGYLSLTRGDGGQNLIGDEQGIELGLIRTHELMAARRIDGAEQFFTRAYDFGFSKSPEETFRVWDHEKVLADAVWVVRRFQPDVIIARFPEDSRAGHGHHSASGIIAREVFEAAADPKRFPEQLRQGVTVWRAKRVLWNTFSFGGRSTIDSTQFSLDAGGYNPLTGLSYGELAGESRSQHKSQGFGVPRSRGQQREFFVPIAGDKPSQDLLDGVDITWNRLLENFKPQLRSSNGTDERTMVSQSLARIDLLVDSLIAAFNPQFPERIVPGLLEIQSNLRFPIHQSVWQQHKLQKVSELIVNCLGLFAEATVPRQFIAEGDSVPLTLQIINRSQVPVRASQYRLGGQLMDVVTNLPFNQNHTVTHQVVMPGGFMASQPYWLRNGLADNLFDVRDQELIGKPVNDPYAISLELLIDKKPVNIRVPIQYKYTDPVKGELYQPPFVTPRHLVYSSSNIVIFPRDGADSVDLNVLVNSWEKLDRKPASVRLKTAAGEMVQSDAAFSSDINSLKSYRFRMGNYLRRMNRESDEVAMEFRPDGQQGYSNAQRTIQYDHVPTLRHYYQDKIRVLNIDLKLGGRRIGYIEGAGDVVPTALQAMGYDVVMLKEADITEQGLRGLDAIMTGVRAYNVHEFLSRKYDVLMQFVQRGGNLVVQYNTNNNIGPIKARMSPYDLTIGRTRVTDEKSPVRFLLPDHPVFNRPNKISPRDFDGWVQERSIYHAQQYDNRFVAPLGLTDFNEGEETGSLVIAPYGKGNFVYTGLVFFRQLPAAVPGAYRLLANLLGLPQNP